MTPSFLRTMAKRKHERIPTACFRSNRSPTPGAEEFKPATTTPPTAGGKRQGRSYTACTPPARIALLHPASTLASRNRPQEQRPLLAGATASRPGLSTPGLIGWGAAARCNATSMRCPRLCTQISQAEMKTGL